MYKELIICIIIVVIIFGANYITQKYTRESVYSIKENLSILRDEMIKDEKNQEKIDRAIEKTNNDWENRYEILAYYIEHDELEKVETHLTVLQADIEVEDYEHGIGELDSCSFVLEHIQDKESLNLRNIF